MTNDEPKNTFYSGWIGGCMKLRKVVSRNITLARVEAGLSKKQFAVKLKADPSNVARIESGRQNLTLDMLERIAKVLGVSAVDLLAQDQTEEIKNPDSVEVALVNAKRLVEILESLKR
jgi:transcriptional regulator with XRE-family HTH domain